MTLINIIVAFVLVTIGACIGFGIAALMTMAQDRDWRAPEGDTYDEEYEGED